MTSVNRRAFVTGLGAVLTAPLSPSQPQLSRTVATPSLAQAGAFA
jgi:hypothetical protein